MSPKGKLGRFSTVNAFLKTDFFSLLGELREAYFSSNNPSNTSLSEDRGTFCPSLPF